MKKLSPASIVYTAVAAVLFLVCAVSVFLPFPHKAGSSLADTYECVWEDGTVTSESYYAACESLWGVENGFVVLEREGRRGKIACAELDRFHTLLTQGSLADLLSADFSALGALERAALVYVFSKVLYYADGEFFSFTGKELSRTETTRASVLSLLAGQPTQREITESLARTLWVHGECTLTGSALVGSYVENFVATAPYVSDGSLLFLDTAGGRRLVACVPGATVLAVTGNDFADEGALLACTALEELTIDFVGNDKSGSGSDYCGEFAHLFATNREYAIPRSLRKVTVTGGRIVTHAFYACGNVREIICCGLSYRDIDRYAFEDCTALEKLHAPRYDLVLADDRYDKTPAPCGCTLYERRTNA